MRSEIEQRVALLRTYDLPDIHFAEVSGLRSDDNTFLALREGAGNDLDSLALNLWYEESMQEMETGPRRDCWLQIGDRIYVVWGARIVSRTNLNKTGGRLEQWEFSFDEMSSYRPCPN